MARDRARTDPLSAESRREVLRDGLRHVRAPQFIPYDETPDPISSREAFKAAGAASATFGEVLAKMGESILFAFAKKNGKNHAAEQFKEIQRGMVIFQQVVDEANIVPPRIKIPTVKTVTPKRKRIPDKVPYYVKLTKPRRR